MLQDTGELMYYDINSSKFELSFAPHFGRETVKRCFQLVCLNSTHNTVRQKYNLFTLLVQNKYGHGVPVAYLISSDATSPTIQKFLSSFKQFCPLVLAFMTDEMCIIFLNRCYHYCKKKLK